MVPATWVPWPWQSWPRRPSATASKPTRARLRLVASGDTPDPGFGETANWRCVVRMPVSTT
jgi:hypothetical protein